MDKIDSTSEHMDGFSSDDYIALCVKDITDKINEIVEWINKQ